MSAKAPPLPRRLGVAPTLLTAQQLAEALAINAQLIQEHLSQMTTANSVKPLWASGPSVNWIGGHILVIRDRVLALLGEPPMLNEVERGYYTVAKPNAAPESLMTVPHQLQLLQRGQEILPIGLGRLSDEDVKRELQVGERKFTVAKRLLNLYFHDTYHAGQLELACQGVRQQSAER